MTPQEYDAYIAEHFTAMQKEIRYPNQTVNWYGKDTEEQSFAIDPATAHLKNTVALSGHEITYAWNSMGYRGPEPNASAKTKILLAGGSVMIGTGLPLEFTLAERIAEYYDADYLNISDYDSLVDTLDPIKQYGIPYDPDIIIIGDTRFITENNWLLALMKMRVREKSPLISKADIRFYQECFDKSNKQAIEMYTYCIDTLFPNAKKVYLIAPRKQFKGIDNMPNQVSITDELLIDLARDGVHPGPDSIELIKNKIIEKLNAIK